MNFEYGYAAAVFFSRSAFHQYLVDKKRNREKKKIRSYYRKKAANQRRGNPLQTFPGEKEEKK